MNVRRVVVRPIVGTQGIFGPVLGPVLGVLLGAVACGGAVGSPREDPAKAGDDGAGASGGAASGIGGVSGHGGTGSGGVTSTYVDPGCPVQPVPETYSECSPLSDGSECGPGMGCYPITEYPSAPCEPEIYQMLCLPAGTQSQWEACATITDCAPGHTCVVTGSGTMCLKMCDPEGRSSCPVGLFCDGVDLQGIGICF